MRLYPRIAGKLAPDCHQRVLEPLAGKIPARLSQFGRRPHPVGPVTARQFPGDDRNRDRIVRAGQALPVPQCLQAARRPARPDEHPAYAEHRSARLLAGSWMAGLAHAGMAISFAASARNINTRRLGAADAFAGAARLASGQLSAGAPLKVIRKPPSTSPEILNIADQASRRT